MGFSGTEIWLWVPWFIALTRVSESPSTRLGLIPQSQVSCGGVGPLVHTPAPIPCRAAAGCLQQGRGCGLPPAGRGDAKGNRAKMLANSAGGGGGGWRLLPSAPETWEGPVCSQPGGVRGGTRKLSEAQTGDTLCLDFTSQRRGRFTRTIQVGGNSSLLSVAKRATWAS